jgi:two-component system sensor histidine kinase/response regulator
MNAEHTKKAAILIVDDDTANLEILFEYLERAELHVLTSQSGENALQQTEHARPDLILMDVVMPDLDGFETCHRLKSHEATREIPVIFMTALTDTAAKIKGFKVGGVDYITKPFQLEEVLARVNTHLTLRRQQQQLQEQTEQLKQLNAEKDHFLSMLAEDLRSPFSTIRHLIGVVAEDLEGSGQDELSNVMRVLQKSSENLYTLLENLLAWSRIQLGVTKYHPYLLDLHKIIVQHIASLTPWAEQKQIKIQNTLVGEILVYADYSMLDDIIRNLLSNAVKFTYPGGSVAVSIQQDEQFVTLAVSDTGIGIEPENMVKLFRIDTKYTRKGTAREQGTGLGLILCKEFIEKHGGKIWVASEAGKGSIFKITLPKPV